MKNIHVLPTNKPSKIYNYVERPDSFFLDLKRERIPVSVVIHKNIYITSNEEIKEEDCTISLNTNRIFKTNKEDIITIKQFPHLYKKIILSTDSDLIRNGVQAIPDEFLEWFVKNPSCEEVKVNTISGNFHLPESYKIIIPKEETKQFEDEFEIQSRIINKVWNEDEPKQETLEEVAWELAQQKFEEKCNYKPNLNTTQDLLVVSSIQEGILIGSKWEQERSYSEEEILPLVEKLKKCKDYFLLKTDKYSDMRTDSIIDVLEQFKKKQYEK